MDILHPLAVLNWERQHDLPVRDPYFVQLHGTWFVSGNDGGSLLTSTDLQSWTECPQPPTLGYTLSTYDSRLVIVGGIEASKMTSDKLWTSVAGINWQVTLPPMSTERFFPSVVSLEDRKCLVVTGGSMMHHLGAVVEVFLEEHWHTVPSLPVPYCGPCIGTLHDGEIYLHMEECLYHCKLECILAATKSQSTSLWEELKCPVDSIASASTSLFSFGHRLIHATTTRHTMKIFAYSPFTQCWVHVQDLSNVYEYQEVRKLATVALFW